MTMQWNSVPVFGVWFLTASQVEGIWGPERGQTSGSLPWSHGRITRGAFTKLNLHSRSMSLYLLGWEPGSSILCFQFSRWFQCTANIKNNWFCLLLCRLQCAWESPGHCVHWFWFSRFGVRPEILHFNKLAGDAIWLVLWEASVEKNKVLAFLIYFLAIR